MTDAMKNAATAASSRSLKIILLAASTEASLAPSVASLRQPVGLAQLFLHFSCHGNEEGIALTNDFVPWPEPTPFLLRSSADETDL